MVQLDDNEFQWILVHARCDQKCPWMLRATHIGQQLFLLDWDWKLGVGSEKLGVESEKYKSWRMSWWYKWIRKSPFVVLTDDIFSRGNVIASVSAGPLRCRYPRSNNLYQNHVGEPKPINNMISKNSLKWKPRNYLPGFYLPASVLSVNPEGTAEQPA